MTHILYIGNRLYFSWSLGAHMMIDPFGLKPEVTVKVLRPETETGIGALLRAQLPKASVARTVPTMVTKVSGTSSSAPPASVSTSL